MSEWSLDWPAPAKINRFLHITGQRPDGYHALQTVFQFVEPVDWLSFAVTADGGIERQGGLADLAPGDDLVVRAAEALQRRSGVSFGALIHLDKRIPAGAGLGGGSSDAATTLVALNRLWGCGFSTQALAELGRSLGADVPVFIRGLAAWAEGIGEELTPMQPDCPWLVLLDPGVAVSTAAVFGDAKLTRHSPHTTIRAFSAGAVRNDCESVVRRLYPVVGEALDALSVHGPAMLTGTGGCMFAPFDSPQRADEAAGLLSERWRVWVCQAGNRSPLLDRAGAEGH